MMTRVRPNDGVMAQRAWLLAAMHLLSLALWACLDDTPIIVDAGTTSTIVDASSKADGDAAHADPNPACRACMEGTGDGVGCGTEMAACATSAQCIEMVECGYDLGCVFKATSEELASCGLPCAVSAGLTDFAAPVTVLAMNLLYCVLPTCGEVCRAKN